MPPDLATLVCALFILYLFWTDSQRRNGSSIALWVPMAWMFLAGSRWASSWLNLGAPLPIVDDYAEGSPIDRAVFSSLIAAGVFILSRRKIDWARLLMQNKWIVLYFLYCLASIAWTDDPFLLFKRWVKDLGNPIMALVILTERRPYEAVAVVLRRLAFLLLPMSVLFIRYYPALGRAYHNDGSPMYTGVGHQKNDLGLICLICGIYLFWKILQRVRGHSNLTERDSLTTIVLIGMLAWLLHMSDSQTSLACLVTAVGLLLMSRIAPIAKKPARIIGVIIVVSLLFLILEPMLHVKDLVLNLLGRDPTLTNRTQMWAGLKSFDTNPFIGVGFMSFWTGDRQETIWKILEARGLNQAHNGYLEQYLNLGVIGLAFIGLIMMSGLLNVRKHLNADPSAAMLRLCFIVTAALYNYTEASFYGMNNMWLLLLLGCIRISDWRAARKVKGSNIKQKRTNSAVVAAWRHANPSPGTGEIRTTHRHYYAGVQSRLS